MRTLPLAATLILGACAHTLAPSRELARAQLLDAREALDGAEEAQDRQQAEDTRSRSYVAERKAETAEAVANAILAASTPPLPEPEPASLPPPGAEALPSDPRAAIVQLEQATAVHREDRGLVVTFTGATLFEAATPTLLPDAIALLETVVSAARGLRGPVVIETHTGDEGSRELSLLISQQRAEAVRAFLVSRGIEPDRVIARGLAPGRALPGTPPGGRTAERVEIVLPEPRARAREDEQ